jgi:hypothetical protein
MAMRTSSLVDFDGPKDDDVAVSAGAVGGVAGMGSGWGQTASTCADVTAGSGISGISYRMSTHSQHTFIAMATTNTTAYRSYNFAVYMNNNRNNVYTYDSDPSATLNAIQLHGTHSTSGPAEDDLWSIEVNSQNKVEFKQNGVAYYTSTTDVVYPWHVIVDLYNFPGTSTVMPGTAVHDISYIGGVPTVTLPSIACGTDWPTPNALTSTEAPTPAPTSIAPSQHQPSTAVGDPHVTNLIGASFDVNQPGEHVLLRTPFDEDRPPQLEVRASIRPAPASPCGLWITEVTFGGEWVGGGEIRVHTSTQGSADDAPGHFALLWRSAGAPVSPRWRPWAEFGKDMEEVLSSNVTVRPTFGAFQGAAAVRDRRIFELLIGAAPTMDERLSIVVAQASRRAALDVQATRLGRLGVARFGGLLGTEEHDPAVEELSSECVSATKHSGWKHVVADSVGSSTQATLFSDPGPNEKSTMTASW